MSSLLQSGEPSEVVSLFSFNHKVLGSRPTLFKFLHKLVQSNVLKMIPVGFEHMTFETNIPECLPASHMGAILLMLAYYVIYRKKQEAPFVELA